MKQYLKLLDYVVWLAVIVLQWILLQQSLRHRLRRLLPEFLIFLSFLCLQSTALFIVAFFDYYSYFVGFYCGMAVETALLVVVVYDVFKTEFAPVGALPSGTLARIVFGGITISTLAITLAIWHPSIATNAIVALCRTLHRTAEFVVCLSLWGLVAYARYLGIPWRSRVAGIARGFLVYLTLQTLTTAGIAIAGPRWVPWLSRAGVISFLVSLFVWLRAVRQPDEVSPELPAPEMLLRLAVLVGSMRSRLGQISSQKSRG